MQQQLKEFDGKLKMFDGIQLQSLREQQLNEFDCKKLRSLREQQTTMPIPLRRKISQHGRGLHPDRLVSIFLKLRTRVEQHGRGLHPDRLVKEVDGKKLHS